MAAFGQKQGGKQGNDAVARSPKDQGGAPQEGIVNAPGVTGAGADKPSFGPGKGHGNSRKGIR